MFLSLAFVALHARRDTKADLAYLHVVARAVVDASRVAPGASIQGGGKNTTGFALRVPGGTQSFYPAFWIRDAAMMLGADLVPSAELDGWIRVVAATQPGPAGLGFSHGLVVPPFSIPDHISLQGAACWFPGAYTNQGDGAYGYLPPADDAFFFIQMAYERCRKGDGVKRFEEKVSTGWGDRPLSEVCDRAFDSVAVDAETGLVVCDGAPGRTRVDWGFCDSIRKTGACLMPSLLRWQAARRLAQLYAAAKRGLKVRHYQAIAATIAKNLSRAFFSRIAADEGELYSATAIGRQDDVWASAFAVWLGVLPPKTQAAVATHLLKLTENGSIVKLGQVRELPAGASWQGASTSPGTYQNGGYWATPTGWLAVALKGVNRGAADALVHEYVSYLRANQAKGAPFEWVNPDIHVQSNANYASSAGLVYIALHRR
ncbi:MAG: glucosidase family protein [Fimbriimonadaceae bacterium]